MPVTFLKDFIASLPDREFEEILHPSGNDCVRLSGLIASAPAFFIAKSFLKTQKPILVICNTPKAAENIYNDLEGFLDEDSVKLFPHRESTMYDGHSPFGHTTEIRFETFFALMQNKPCIVIATVQALMQKIVSPKDLAAATIRLEVFQQVEMEDIRTWLVQMGFVNAPIVEEIGQFSVRGGILDVFPFLSDHPVRIEFWGDEIESIREFDVFTQRSREKCDTVHILPMQEFLIEEEETLAGLELLESRFGKETAYQEFEHKMLLGLKDTGIEWHIGWFKNSFSTLLDYFKKDTLIFELKSNQSWKERHKELYDLYSQNYAKTKSHGYLLFSPPEDLLWTRQELESKKETFPQIEITFLDAAAPDKHYTVKEQPKYLSAISSFIEDITLLRSGGYQVCVLCDNKGQVERMEELLEYNASKVHFLVGTISQGFIIEEFKLALYTDHQIFNRYARKIKYRKYKGGVSIPSLEALTPGDYVVHEDHGIGRFHGIERMEAGGGVRDCMLIIFAGNDKLYTPVENFEKIQKYVGKDGTPPVLSKLGSKNWEKIKARTKKSIQGMAKGLIELYAKRKYQPGYAFQPDTHWQKEFENAFIYEETPDQLKATKDIKADMEKNHPTDRLICGDVGFGKTEVAVRAVFKCVMNSKQSAILVPTTILAAQHLQSMRERLAGFPVKIEMLSRFVSAKDKKKIIAELAGGKVDIIIGTHRLLSKDIVFKDLGLLVVDEEHRFGVKHKEKIKHMRNNVDVISMTATPIPRTLHMSLLGARDISLINTPPLNRLPIQTKVMEFSEKIIATAIRQELSREGQVYCVHNRVQTIAAFAEMVERLVPEARIATVHGQMNERDLEEIMRSFTQGHFDVLVSTMIIESGLDIPNVNTLIVNRADMFGLASLYQLRGRVGRSSVQAYAYLLTPRFSRLKDDAVRRLKTLEQFTELGSGFQIAMRDMEIRGAGNILGTQQHGFVIAVGFEMYMRLLKESMQELRGESQALSVDPKIDVDIKAYLPDSYVKDPEQRVTLYQKISGKEDIESLKEMHNELCDRFGDPPREVRSLLAIMSMKVAAKKLFFSKISIKYDRMLLEFAREYEPDQKQIGIIMEKIVRPFEIIYETPLKISVELSEPDPFLKLQQAQKVVGKLLL